MMKIGVEVEGRYKGLKSLFVSADELGDVAKGEEVLPADIVHEVAQVYISDLANKVRDFDAIAEALRKGCSHALVITFERTELLRTTPQDIHIILQVKPDSFLNLKLTDQVKFEGGLFDPAVFTVTKEQMVQTCVGDYDSDRLVQDEVRR